MAQHQLAPDLIAKRLPLEEIPVIKLAPFLEGRPDDRLAVAHKIGHACRHIGFFYIVEHGVSQSLIDETFAQAKRFFDLPDAVKQEISIDRSAVHRGYFSLGGENLDPAKQMVAGDLKEGLKIGRDLPLDHPLVAARTPLHGPNQWPANLPGWRETMEACYGALSDLGFELMRGFALALELPEDFFDDKLTEPMATLGPLHYPAPRRPGHRAALGRRRPHRLRLPDDPVARPGRRSSRSGTRPASGSTRPRSPAASWSTSAI